MSNYIGLYIHIPFCRSKCPYCDFFSLRGNHQEYERYVKILKDKIAMWSNKIDKTVNTIYFGGGTPSVIGAELLCDILDFVKSNFKITDDCEITFEVNPASGLFFDFNKAKKHGFNRVSVGLQSANENELKTLGRIHSKDDVLSTIQLIKQAGINNISLDLMMGIPNQTVDSLKKSIDFCEKCDVTHISSYILKIEENTVFYKRQDKLNLPDEDLTSDLYLFAIDYLKKKGFQQYEISNFSKSGYESQHNMKYWILDDYLGIGPGAHSYVDGRRFYYDRSIDDFENDKIINDGIGGSKEEYIMLRLRLTDGIDLNEYEKVFGSDAVKDFKKDIEKYVRNNFMKINDNKVFFTPNGMLVSNTILADLLYS